MVKKIRKRPWAAVLPLLSCLLLLSLSACGKDTDLVCERCGAMYTVHGDYSDKVKEDQELTEVYGIDYISFYCEDCFNEVFHNQAKYSAYVESLVSAEDLQVIREYQAGQKRKEEIYANKAEQLPGELICSTGADSYWVCRTEDGMYGIYNETTQALVDDMRYEQITDFDEVGMAWAYFGGYWGCIDHHGTPVTPFQFSDVRAFQGEYAIVCMNQYGVIDRSGAFVIQPMYDEIKLYESVAQVKADKKYGLVNYNGEVMVTPENEKEFQFIGPYVYSGTQKDRYGFNWGKLLDQSGQSLMDKIPVSGVNEISYAGEGMLRVRRESPSVPDNHYYGVEEIYLLNEDLNLVSKQSFLYVSDFSSNGYAAACTFESYSRDLYGIHINDGGWTAIDKQGNWLENLKPLQGDFSYNHYGAHYIYVGDDFAVADNWNGTYSLLDLHNEEMTQWDYIWTFPGTQCICTKSSETGLYTLYDGYELVDGQCTEIKTLNHENGDLYGFTLHHGATETVYHLHSN